MVDHDAIPNVHLSITEKEVLCETDCDSNENHIREKKSKEDKTEQHIEGNLLGYIETEEKQISGKQ